MRGRVLAAAISPTISPKNRRALSATAAAGLAVLASDAFAQVEDKTVFYEEGGYYFSHFWLFSLIGYCVLWVAVYDWVGRDAEQLKGRQKFWSSAIMSVGGAGFLLMLFISMGAAFPFGIALFSMFVVYVWQRNLRLPEERRVFTLTHLKYLLRRLAERLHLRKTAGAVVQAVRPGEAKPQIVLLRKDGNSLDDLTDGRSSGASEAVMAVKALIESGVLSRATDVHIEPKQGELQARFRIDGILHNVPSYPQELAMPMISSIKVLSDMDIAEKRKPQDGTFIGRHGDKELDFRVSTTPSVYGETMVIRILDRGVGMIGLGELGMPSAMLKPVRRIINYPNGMFIVSGPTGSGKTTSLYSMLSEIDAFQKNIITIENPIEYRLDNVNQTQVNPKAGVTFASALRSFLRQDPDVIMVGEIRDAETARVALQAAMTGHFVFTTIHANDSVTTLFRLLDLGVEPYLISSSLSGVLAQRLMRVLCIECKAPYQPQPQFLKKIGLKPTEELELFKAQGCDACQGTGFKGRIGVFELFEINDAIQDLIRTNPSIQLIKTEARKGGWRTLQESGLAKVIEGVTSVKELVRVTR